MMETYTITYIKASFIVFVSVFIFAAFCVPDISSNLFTQLTPDDIANNSGKDKLEFFKSVLLNNLRASLLVICMGVFGYEIIPMLAIALNAAYLGSFVAMINKPDTWFAVLTLIPHGIIEFVALILSCAFGCLFAIRMRRNRTSVIQCIRNRKVTESQEKRFWYICKYTIIIPYLKYCVPMLIVAAFIESYISMDILHRLFI